MNWIAVTTEVPKEIIPVVARYYRNTPYTAQYVRGCWYDNNGLDRCPSHWMPLPEFKQGREACI